VIGFYTPAAWMPPQWLPLVSPNSMWTAVFVHNVWRLVDIQEAVQLQSVRRPTHRFSHKLPVTDSNPEAECTAHKLSRRPVRKRRTALRRGGESNDPTDAQRRERPMCVVCSAGVLLHAAFGVYQVAHAAGGAVAAHARARSEGGLLARCSSRLRAGDVGESPAHPVEPSSLHVWMSACSHSSGHVGSSQLANLTNSCTRYIHTPPTRETQAQ
jgi:hypothetical protein